MSQCVTEEPVLETELMVDVAAEGRPLYYGWVMLPLAMATLIASSPGQTFGISIFNEPMRLSLGLSHGQLAAAYMLGTLLGAIPIGFIGRQMDRHGLRRTLLVVVSLFSLACVLTSAVQGWLALAAAFCLLRMLGPGALGLLSGNTLAFWFDRRLGMVEGFRQVGMALAMATIPMLNLWLVSHWGWRGAYGILGASIWLLLFPVVVIWFRNHPADVGQRLDGIGSRRLRNSEDHATNEVFWGLTLGEALRTRAFWIVASGTATFGLIHTAVFFCLVPMFQERGLTAGVAATTLTVFAASLAAMQLVGGMLADRIRASYLLCAGMTGLGTAILLLFHSNSSAMALVVGAALGASQGMFFGAAHPLWARYFGRRHLGKIRGTLMTINVGSSSLGPLFAGLSRDVTGDFNLSLAVFAFAPFPIALLSLLVAPPGRETDPHYPALAAADSFGEIGMK
ncbi:MAG: MFS transporter [Pirellulaceae bacterium]